MQCGHLGLYHVAVYVWECHQIHVYAVVNIGTQLTDSDTLPEAFVLLLEPLTHEWLWYYTVWKGTTSVHLAKMLHRPLGTRGRPDALRSVIISWRMEMDQCSEQWYSPLRVSSLCFKWVFFFQIWRQRHIKSGIPDIAILDIWDENGYYGGGRRRAQPYKICMRQNR